MSLRREISKLSEAVSAQLPPAEGQPEVLIFVPNDGRVMDTSGCVECKECSYLSRRVRSTFHRPRNRWEAAAGEVGTLRRGAGKYPCKGR
jgi:hypothetical protein